MSVVESSRSFPRRPSIYDVARAAGVSLATVSRVVNDRPGVSEELKSFVLGVVASIGYVPKPADHRPGPKVKDVEPATSALRVLDLFIAYPLKLGEFPIRTPLFSRMLDDLELAASAAGLEVYVRQTAAPLPANYADAVVGRIYFGNGAEGIEEAAPWVGSDLPMVWMVAGDRAPFPGDAVRVDHERVGEIAARHLRAHGHRHACYIGFPPSRVNGPMLTRGDSFTWWFPELGGVSHRFLDAGLHDEGEANTVQAVIDRCLALEPRPTALFLEMALLTPRVWQALQARGIRPQIDIEILVCNNDELFLHGLTPRPGVIDIPSRQMADLAIELITRPRPRGPDTVPMRHLVAPRLLPG